MIKFRVWDIVNKEYTYSPNRQFLIGLDGRLFDGNGCQYDESHIIEQFTGLKDKNGKEIYEGDIVKYCHRYLPYAGIARYCDTRCGFELHGKNEDSSGIVDFTENLFQGRYYPYQIIGNIHENPELLAKCKNV